MSSENLTKEELLDLMAEMFGDCLEYIEFCSEFAWFETVADILEDHINK